MPLSIDVTHNNPVTSSGLLATVSLGTCPQICTYERHDNRIICWAGAEARIVVRHNLQAHFFTLPETEYKILVSLGKLGFVPTHGIYTRNIRNRLNVIFPEDTSEARKQVSE